MTLTGILKSILLVIISIAIWQTQITPLQSLGYTIALVGLSCYTLGSEQLSKGYYLASSWAGETWKKSGNGDGGWSPARRRCLVLTGVLCFISMIVVVGIWQGPVAVKKAAGAFPSFFGSE